MISEGLDVFHGYESHFKDHKLSPGETYFIPLVSDPKKKRSYFMYMQNHFRDIQYAFNIGLAENIKWMVSQY